MPMFEYYNCQTTEIERLCIKNTILLFENYLNKKQSSKFKTTCTYVYTFYIFYFIKIITYILFVNKNIRVD